MFQLTKEEAEFLLSQMESHKADGNYELYNQKVDLHNSLVPRINFLSEELQTITDEYNGQFAIFNQCLVE